ncbi:MAG: PfkB family carbohydrate kinase [Chloroflexota bacterium]
MRTLDVVGFGALNLDEILRVPRVLLNDETVVEEHLSAPGGSAANTVYALAKLGARTGFIGAVGDDEAGQVLLRDLREGDVDTTGVKAKSGSRSGRVLAITDRQGQRALYVEPGANDTLAQEDVDLSYACATRFLHLSSFAGDVQLDLQKWLVSKLPDSVRVSFAPGALYAKKGLDALSPILNKTYVLFANQQEIEELAGMEYRAAARNLIGQGCTIVAVTSRSGSHIVGSGNEYTIESAAVEHPTDTTGAGDAYAAGFLYGLLLGKGLEECGRLGDLTARFCITGMGARAGLPTEAQLLEAYKKS